MKPGRARGRWLALLFGAALSLGPVHVSAAPPELVSEGFVRQDLKEIRASILRPEKWLWRLTLPAVAFYNFSPQPFQRPLGIERGVAIHMLVKNGEPADDRVAKTIADMTVQPGVVRVVRGWTRKATPAEPFATHGLVYIFQGEKADDVKMTCELVLVANRTTNTVYQGWLVAPTDQWKEMEQVGEAMLASFRPDPEF